MKTLLNRHKCKFIVKDFHVSSSMGILDAWLYLDEVGTTETRELEVSPRFLFLHIVYIYLQDEDRLIYHQF